ncbi:Protein LHY [Phytophthora citrophthora]|uniref:Protein LHY n=1 Tax=Phytophthora citrophthora TaxID=4793 RepID=A0AAD9GY24_9STRA|nr:Protein LHY [Phytophthora citrophthora]
MSLETEKTKPSATAAPAPAPSSNATHQKGQTGMNGGRWTEQEHQSFLAGLRLYGREWKKVAAKIKTRTSAQIRSHAQKYFAKLARDDEMRKHSGFPMVMSGPVGYFSDGGSSVAQNSGEDDGDGSDVSRQMARAHLPGQAKGSAAAVLIAPMGSAISALYKQTSGTTKKRSRVATTVFEDQLGSSSSYPYKLQKRTNNATRVEYLPSQEELLAKASPNLRHRLSSLIEAELCALQVLSCYAMLQHQDQTSAPRQKVKRQGRPRKLATVTTSATGSGAASSLGFSMLSNEQIPSTSSIY